MAISHRKRISLIPRPPRLLSHVLGLKKQEGLGTGLARITLLLELLFIKRSHTVDVTEVKLSSSSFLFMTQRE